MVWRQDPRIDESTQSAPQEFRALLACLPVCLTPDEPVRSQPTLWRVANEGLGVG